MKLIQQYLEGNCNLHFNLGWFQNCHGQWKPGTEHTFCTEMPSLWLHCNASKRAQENLKKHLPWEEKAQGDFIHVYTRLMEGYKENRATCFPVASGGGRRANEHKLKYRIAHFNTRKSFFTVRLLEHWHRFSGDVVESPSLVIFTTLLEKALTSLSHWLCFEWRLD